MRDVVFFMAEMGLFLTVIGAGVAANGFRVDEERVGDPSRYSSGAIEAIERRLLDPSERARYGLQLIALGTILQMVATAVPTVMG